MPASPVGAKASGMLAGSPAISTARLRSAMSTATRWRSLMLEKSSTFARSVLSVNEPPST